MHSTDRQRRRRAGATVNAGSALISLPALAGQRHFSRESCPSIHPLAGVLRWFTGPNSDVASEDASNTPRLPSGIRAVIRMPWGLLWPAVPVCSAQTNVVVSGTCPHCRKSSAESHRSARRTTKRCADGLPNAIGTDGTASSCRMPRPAGLTFWLRRRIPPSAKPDSLTCSASDHPEIPACRGRHSMCRRCKER